jgi:hypothetical protein
MATGRLPVARTTMPAPIETLSKVKTATLFEVTNPIALTGPIMTGGSLELLMA